MSELNDSQGARRTVRQRRLGAWMTPCFGTRLGRGGTVAGRDRQKKVARITAMAAVVAAKGRAGVVIFTDSNFEIAMAKANADGGPRFQYDPDNGYRDIYRRIWKP